MATWLTVPFKLTVPFETKPAHTALFHGGKILLLTDLFFGEKWNLLINNKFPIGVLNYEVVM